MTLLSLCGVYRLSAHRRSSTPVGEFFFFFFFFEAIVKLHDLYVQKFVAGNIFLNIHYDHCQTCVPMSCVSLLLVPLF